MRLQTLSLVALTASVASAHYQVLYPPQNVEFEDEEQATAPCGGLAVNLDGAADVPVDQFAVSIRSSHPEGTWAFRGTLNTEEPYEFEDITPNVNTEGVGEFCLTSLSVPSEWAGSQGVIQVVDIADDGMLYQCIPANFVEGANSTIGPACTNATGFTASYAQGESAMPSGTASLSHDMSDMTMSETASATGEAAESTSAPGAAAAMATGVGALAGLGMVVAGLAL